jgi:hypothetical protein
LYCSVDTDFFHILFYHYISLEFNDIRCRKPQNIGKYETVLSNPHQMAIFAISISGGGGVITQAETSWYNRK